MNGEVVLARVTVTSTTNKTPQLRSNHFITKAINFIITKLSVHGIDYTITEFQRILRFENSFRNNFHVKNLSITRLLQCNAIFHIHCFLQDFHNITIYEPCNYASNVAYYHVVTQICKVNTKHNLCTQICKVYYT